ncbi:MAG TPA: O-methyltransferase [Thermoleophilaceae bacterium]
MAIRDPKVERYLHGLRPERSEVMREMEALAERDGVPIVEWETGRFLATLVRATGARRVLEVGTAIGYSTVHMAEGLVEGGAIVTLEIDEERAAQARSFLDRAGVGDRVEIVLGDARETIPTLDGSWNLIFVDAAKDEYRRYIELAEPQAAERCTLVIDNLLMGGAVAAPESAETHWRPESLAAARELNRELLDSERWLGSVLPIGDGVGFAVRR